LGFVFSTLRAPPPHFSDDKTVAKMGHPAKDWQPRPFESAAFSPGGAVWGSGVEASIVWF